MNLNGAKKCYERVLKIRNEIVAALNTCKHYQDLCRICKNHPYFYPAQWKKRAEYYNFNAKFPSVVVIRYENKGAILYHTIGSGECIYEDQAYTVYSLKDGDDNNWFTWDQIKKEFEEKMNNLTK